MFSKTLLVLLSSLLCYSIITCSILDNRVDVENSTEVVIRAERNHYDDGILYKLSPYRPNFAGNRAHAASPRPQILPPLRPLEDCPPSSCAYSYFQNAYWPLVVALCFFIIAVVVYLFLFCVVFRFFV